MSGSEAIQREINPRMTTESSTTITRNGSCRIAVGAEELVNVTLITHQVRLKTARLKRTPRPAQPPDRNRQTQIR
jgi:hypothetical protein